MTGVEFPGPGKVVFHFTWEVALHSVGRSVSSVTPSWEGPRQEGQFAAGSDAVMNNEAKSARCFMMRSCWPIGILPALFQKRGSGHPTELAFHIKAGDEFLIAKVELAIADHGMGPDLALRFAQGGLWLEFEASVFTPAVR